LFLKFFEKKTPWTTLIINIFFFFCSLLHTKSQ